MKLRHLIFSVCLALILVVGRTGLGQDRSPQPPGQTLPSAQELTPPPVKQDPTKSPAAQTSPAQVPTIQVPDPQAPATNAPSQPALKPVPEQQAATPEKKSSESFLPNSTRAWISVPNPKFLNEAFAKTQLGQLVHDESLKPFVEDLTDQLRSMIDGDMQYGIRLSKLENMETGEICIAGILPRDATGAIKPERRAVVVLVDVSKCKDQAEKLLEETAVDLTKAHAVPTTEVINDIKTTKWTFPAPRGRARQRVAHHAIVNDWLVASNEADSFRQVIRWISRPDLPVVETLANDKDFQKIMKRSKFDDARFPEHIRWYVDVFGYLDLARILAEEAQDPATRERSTNFTKIVKECGFDAIRGVSGEMAFDTGEHEILHRTFIYAPPVPAAGQNRYLQAAAILDFVNRDKISLEPEAWVPKTASSYVSFIWDFGKLVNNVKYIVDALADDGSFDRMLENLIQSNHLDVRELVKHLNNRISVVSEVVEPITADSEKIVVAFGIKDSADFVREQVRNYFGGELAVNKINDIEVYSQQEEKDTVPPVFGNGFDDDETPAADDSQIFEKAFVTVHHDAILVSNDLEYLKKILTSKPSDLANAEDFGRIRSALNKLVDPAKISLRHFGRLDQVLRANYELTRRNELKSAKTLLARILAKAHDDAVKQGKVVKPFDGSKLPVFKTEVAPFLGPVGWIVESDDDGWRITSCQLIKKPSAADVQVADKPTDPTIEKKQ